MSYKEVFSNIYDNHGFGSLESRSGPGSTLDETAKLRESIKQLVKEKEIKSVVDIPCGDFNWMKEIVFSFEYYTGGDIVPQCIQQNNERYSNSRIKFVEFDLLQNSIPDADLLIVRDVIGHLPIEDGKKLVQNILKSNCKYLLSTTWAKKTENGWTSCAPNDVDRENEGVDYGRFYPVNLMSEPFNFPEPDYIIEEDVRVDKFDEGNRKVLAFWEIDKVKKFISNPNKAQYVELDKNKKNLTIVTGLWSIGRPNRSFDHYLECFSKLLETDQYMFIYVPKEYEEFVKSRRSPDNTYIKVYELEDIKNLYSPFWDKTQEIRNSEEWLNQTGEWGWLKESPQAVLEWYNPIVQSKMFLLNDATIWNPFNTEYFIWLDAGITNTVYEKYFSENEVLTKINPHLETFLFLSYPYENNNEIHGFNKKSMDRYARSNVKYVCRGGLFGGKKEYINLANAEYYTILENSLRQNLMGTEESIFTIMSYLNPQIYRRYELDENGLIVKFIQDLIDDNVQLVELKNKRKLKPLNPDISNLKTNLYMLTFNFPQQIEHTIETWQRNSSDWITKTNKILIDNSTNDEARLKNKEIADKWGFEHIIMNENKGICGGRQFAAEHFDKSDADFYLFFEDDMGFHTSEETGFCRNGFRKYVPNLYNKIHKIMLIEGFDFLKLSYTEVYMDNNIQVSWYNVPQNIRNLIWPDYNQLPISGLDPNAPRTQFKNIEVFEELSYASGEIYYANWPMIVSREGNKKMFLETTWANPFEQTWMSYMFQQTLDGNLNPAVLLAAPIHHNRIAYYKAEERREN